MFRKIHRYIEIFFLNSSVFCKKATWFVLKRVAPSPKGVVQVNIGGHLIDTIPSRHLWWKSMYYKYCDVEIEFNIKKYLSKGNIFIDVGAGIGYFSAIAPEVVGDSGQVHCFEPFLPQIESIQKMIKSKPNSNIILNDCALGADEGVQDFYLNRDVRGWSSSMIKNFIEKFDEVFKVRTRRLDTYLKEKNIDKVSLIKIDVEGYEYNVFKGLSGFFEETMFKPPIICEIWLYGYSLVELHDYMSNYGYQAYNIFNSKKKVDVRLLSKMTDVVFLPIRK